jgi:uncharacterized membrane protein YccC
VDRAALQAGIRAAVAVSTGFAIGRYALDDPQFAVFAGFTAMALLAFADYGGPVRIRLLAFAVTVAVALGLVALGTAVSESSWGGPLAVGCIAFAVAYAAVLGGYFVAGTNAAILFAVLAAGIPAPEGALDSRLAGTLVGGALAAAASVLLWPARPVRDAGRPLGRAAAALAVCLGAGAADREGSLAAAKAEVRAARARLGDLAHRPSEPTARHRAILRLVSDLDRLLGRIAGMVRHGPPPPGPGRGFLDGAEAGLGAVAASLAGRRPPDEAVDLERRLRTSVPEARAALAARAAETDPATLAREAEETAIAGEVAQAATLAALDAEIVAGRRPTSVHPSVIQLLDEPVLTATGRRLRANLTLRSVHMRNALRLGIALALALALAHALDLQHGFWVVLATLTVVRTTASATSVTAWGAVVGTAVGFAIAIVVILGAEADSHLYVILLGLAVCAAVYAARTGGVLAGQAAFTVLVVVLFSLLTPSDWTIALVRVEDVAAGALVGVAIGLIAWPRGAGGLLPGAVADVVDRAVDEVESAARRELGRGGRDDPAALRAATLAAASRAEDDLAVALGERRPPAGAVDDRWPALLADAGAVWYSIVWLDDVPGAGAPPGGCMPLTAALLSRTDGVAAGYRAAAAALRAGDPPPRPLAPPGDEVLVARCAASPPTDEPCREALVRLLVLRHWVRELEGGLARLTARIEEIGARRSDVRPGRLRLPPRLRRGGGVPEAAGELGR